MDLVGDNDVTEAKSYVKSVYEITAFTNQSAFEKFALKLFDLKFRGRESEAVVEFMKYAVCDRIVAERIVDLL